MSVPGPSRPASRIHARNAANGQTRTDANDPNLRSAGGDHTLITVALPHQVARKLLPPKWLCHPQRFLCFRVPPFGSMSVLMQVTLNSNFVASFKKCKQST